MIQSRIETKEVVCGLSFDAARLKVVQSAKKCLIELQSVPPSIGTADICSYSILIAAFIVITYVANMPASFYVGFYAIVGTYLPIILINCSIMTLYHSNINNEIFREIESILVDYERSVLRTRSNDSSTLFPDSGITSGHSQTSIVNTFRNSVWQRIPVLLLAEGDIIALMGGDIAPGDVFELDESFEQLDSKPNRQRGCIVKKFETIKIRNKKYTNESENKQTPQNFNKRFHPSEMEGPVNNGANIREMRGSLNSRKKKNLTDRLKSSHGDIKFTKSPISTHRSLAPDNVELLKLSGDLRCFQMLETPIEHFIASHKLHYDSNHRSGSCQACNASDGTRLYPAFCKLITGGNMSCILPQHISQNCSQTQSDGFPPLPRVSIIRKMFYFLWGTAIVYFQPIFMLMVVTAASVKFIFLQEVRASWAGTLGVPLITIFIFFAPSLYLPSSLLLADGFCTADLLSVHEVILRWNPSGGGHDRSVWSPPLSPLSNRGEDRRSSVEASNKQNLRGTLSSNPLDKHNHYSFGFKGDEFDEGSLQDVESNTHNGIEKNEDNDDLDARVEDSADSRSNKVTWQRYWSYIIHVVRHRVWIDRKQTKDSFLPVPLARVQLLEKLGGVTMVCFVDDDIIYEQYSVTEEVFLLTDAQQHTSTDPTATSMKGNANQRVSGMGKFHKGKVLDLHANPQASGSRFENPLWWHFLPSLKPIALNALLTYKSNPNNSQEMESALTIGPVLSMPTADRFNDKAIKSKNSLIESKSHTSILPRNWQDTGSMRSSAISPLHQVHQTDGHSIRFSQNEVARSLVRHIRRTLPLESLRELAEEIGFSESVDVTNRIHKLLEVNVVAPRMIEDRAQYGDVEDSHQWGQEESRRRGTLHPQLRGIIFRDGVSQALQLMSLGDPALLLHYCREYWDGSSANITPLTASDRAEILQVYDRWRLEDFDVVAFGYNPIPALSLHALLSEGIDEQSTRQRLRYSVPHSVPDTYHQKAVFFVDPSTSNDLKKIQPDAKVHRFGLDHIRNSYAKEGTVDNNPLRNKTEARESKLDLLESLPTSDLLSMDANNDAKVIARTLYVEKSQTSSLTDLQGLNQAHNEPNATPLPATLPAQLPSSNFIHRSKDFLRHSFTGKIHTSSTVKRPSSQSSRRNLFLSPRSFLNYHQIDESRSNMWLPTSSVPYVSKDDLLEGDDDSQQALVGNASSSSSYVAVGDHAAVIHLSVDDSIESINKEAIIGYDDADVSSTNIFKMDSTSYTSSLVESGHGEDKAISRNSSLSQIVIEFNQNGNETFELLENTTDADVSQSTPSGSIVEQPISFISSLRSKDNSGSPDLNVPIPMVKSISLDNMYRIRISDEEEANVSSTMARSEKIEVSSFAGEISTCNSTQHLVFQLSEKGNLLEKSIDDSDAPRHPRSASNSYYRQSFSKSTSAQWADAYESRSEKLSPSYSEPSLTPKPLLNALNNFSSNMSLNIPTDQSLVSHANECRADESRVEPAAVARRGKSHSNADFTEFEKQDDCQLTTGRSIDNEGTKGFSSHSISNHAIIVSESSNESKNLEADPRNVHSLRNTKSPTKSDLTLSESLFDHTVNKDVLVRPEETPSSHTPPRTDPQLTVNKNMFLLNQGVAKPISDLRKASLRHLWSLLRQQVFLGMAASSVPVRPEVPRVMEDLNAAGVRFVYFSPRNMKRSKPVAEKIGIVFDWNCAISLRDLSDEQSHDPHRHISQYADWDVHARLPHGIDAIRKHLISVDNVPLLVSLYTDSLPDKIQQMIDIFQEHGESVLTVGSGYRLLNHSIYFQADVAVSVAVLPTAHSPLNATSVISGLPSRANDLIHQFPEISANALSRSDLVFSFRLIALGTVPFLLQAPYHNLPNQTNGGIDPKKNTTDSQGKENTKSVQLSLLLEAIRKGRIYLLNAVQVLGFLCISTLCLSSWTIVSFAVPISIPPSPSLPLALLFGLFYVPLLALTMLVSCLAPPNVMKTTPRKNLLQIKAKDINRFCRYVFIRCAAVAVSLLLTGWFTAANSFQASSSYTSFATSLLQFHHVDLQTNDPDTLRSYWLIQDMMANSTFVSIIVQFYTLLERGQSMKTLASSAFSTEYLPIHVIIVTLGILHGVMMWIRETQRLSEACTIQCQGMNHYCNLNAVVWITAVGWPICSGIAMAAITNSDDSKHYRRYIQLLRLNFDTRLGMHSPR